MLLIYLDIKQLNQFFRQRNKIKKVIKKKLHETLHDYFLKINCVI